MRVIAGTARGIRLAAPRGMQTRPTADRVREALFSIIQSRMELEGARILDICAGSGALGIEALSRGGAAAVFIESGAAALQCIRKNLQQTQCMARAELLQMDALKGVRLLGRRDARFELVLFDPPYASQLYDTIPAEISTEEMLAQDGLLVAECTARMVLQERFGTLVKIDRRVYGDSALELYTREDT